MESKNGKGTENHIGNGVSTFDKTTPKEANMTDKNLQEDFSKESTPEENEVEELKKKRREKNPLFYCKLITKYPKAAFGLTLGGHMLMMAIFGILFLSGYDILPLRFEGLPLDIRDNKYFLRGLAWDERRNGSQYFDRGDAEEKEQDERSQFRESITWIFQLEGGNVLTKENLKLMKEVEDDLFQMKEYQESYCLLINNTCAKPTSILRFFDGTYKDVNPVFDDPDFDNVQDVLYNASYHNETKVQLAYHLGLNSEITKTKAEAAVIRAYMLIGFPLEGYSTDEDKESEQQDLVKEFMQNTLLDNAQKHFEDGVGEMNFLYNSQTFLQIYIQTLVFLDLALVGGSFAFIFLFMWFQTRSLWVTFFAILSIFTSFCASNLIYRIVLEYRYFGVFHVLALFIILGIGADDVFVFFDTWKESSHQEYKSLAHRVSDCYRRAAFAMLYTSLTTAVAFCVSAGSPFLSVSTFGIFACLLIVVNYISVIVYFPTVVVMYHLYFEKYKCCCCGRQGTDVHDISQPTKTKKRKNLIVRFFRGPFFKFVTHKIIRWFIVVGYSVLLAVFIYFATTLQVNEEQLKFLPDETNTGQFLNLRANEFDTGDLPLRVFVIFGLKEQDLSDCHRSDDLCYGKVVWDEGFNLNSPEAQQGFRDICNSIKNVNTSFGDTLKIKESLVTGKWEVQCFLSDMESFFEDSPLPVTYPFLEADAQTVMASNPILYNASQLPSDYSNWLEIPMSYWLYNGFDLSSGFSDDFLAYNPMLGEGELAGTVRKDIPQADGGSFTFKYGTELKFAAIIVNTTINPRILGFPKGAPIREEWEEFVTGLLKDKPSELKNGFQTTPFDYWGFNLWHWLQIQETLSTSAVIGIAVGLCLALPILIIATMNFITGILATLTICCITVSVVGILPMAGWKLGLLESLNMVLVVGLAVDYCVHLAEGYSRAESSDRLGRVQTALEEVGISVVSGSCSTLGASFFMIFAQILFFTQFGIFMFCTIGFSLLYSLGLFITVLGIIGPQNKTGSLVALWHKMKACCCKKKAASNKETEAQLENGVTQEKQSVSNGYVNGAMNTGTSKQSGFHISLVKVE